MPVDHVKYAQPTDNDRTTTLVTPEEKGSLIETSKAVDTDWFGANITPTNTPAVLRIQMRLATASVVNLLFDDSDETVTNLVMELNAGSALGANDLFTFDVVVLVNQSFNIQHKTATQNIFCSVVEINKFI